MKWAFMVFLVGSMLVAGCGRTEKAENRTADIKEQTAQSLKKIEKAKKAHPAEVKVDPCKLLTADLIHAHFDTGKAEVKFKSDLDIANPICTAKWKKPNAAEIEKKMQSAMMDYVQAQAQGKKVPMPDMRTNDEVSLTISGSRFETAAAAASDFQSAMKSLNQGVSASSGGQTFTFQAHTTPVEGVGDQAQWSAKMHQLSVQSGNHIFHVTVRMHSDAAKDLPKAKELATAVAGNLD